MEMSMSRGDRGVVGRRAFLGGAVAAGASGFWSDETLDSLLQHTRTASKPTDLKITDLRVAVVGKAPMRCPIIRIDTNQGIYGLGEVRDGASKTYALMLKSRILGENPCNIDKIFRKIKQFGFHGRQGGGVSAIEMALWDLAGKAYGVPVYQMLGGKFRDRIRLYADTPESHDPKVYAERMKKRMEAGFTWLKMDLGVDLVEKVPGALTRPLGTSTRDFAMTPHMFTGMELTDKGVALMAEYVAAIREVIGWDIPLASGSLRAHWRQFLYPPGPCAREV
jgi:L-alanine-DL-glutamate epimerase-like enolase superfamily enzyme